MNTNFPIIRHLSDLLPYIQDNPQFRVAEQSNGMIVACYMIQDEDTFTGANEEYAKECRGITFYSDGTIACRTLHKFLNVGESEKTQPHNIPWERIVRCMDKRDGSMISFVEVDGRIVAKTKKTFTSNEAQAATEFLHKDQAKVDWVRRMISEGFSPIFEWTSPRFPIVLQYDKDELILLQIRENVSGRYITSLGEGDEYTKDCPFPVIENLIDEFMVDGQVSWDKLKHAAETRTGIEGWIIQADDGEMWKVKTAWYLELHGAVTFARWRDVAKAVIDDTSDDLKAAFALVGRSIKPIEEIEHKINSVLVETEKTVQEIVEEGVSSGKDAKTMALTYKNHPLFGLIMTSFRGKPVNFREWYAKNHLDEWSLEVIPSVFDYL